MPEKTLIVYFSKGGGAEAYARIVAQLLRSRGQEVDEVNLREKPKPKLEGYENVVVGTGVRIGMVYRKAKKFLRRKDLAGKRLAIFLSSGIAVESAEQSKEKFLAPLVRKYGLAPVMYDAFPGKIPGPGGELQDKTDPERAREWAEELAAKLAEPAGKSQTGAS